MSLLALCRLQSFATLLIAVTALNTTEIFQRPLIARIYESGQYALANINRSTGDRVDIATVASSIAGLKPSYVSSLLRLEYGTNLTSTMINDFNVIRSAVLAVSPNAKFDVELNLDPNRLDGKPTYPNAAAVVSYMEQLDSQLKLDGWWFDFYSTAQKEAPDWVVAVTGYAHSHNQTVGGNVFGNIVPPASDAVSFVDDPNNSTYGFGIMTAEVAALKHNTSSTVILGHLNCNPQNGNTTESCVYMYDWNSTRRAEYLDYWLSQQKALGFTYMVPVFFPLCPGAYSFDPTSDILGSNAPNSVVSGANATFYDYIRAVGWGNGSSAAATTSALATGSSHTATSDAQPRQRVSVVLTLLVLLFSSVKVIFD